MSAATQRRLRVAVIGGGEIAQVVHLPNLWRLRDRFDLRAVVDPSQTVRETLAQRYSIAGYADHRELLDSERLDALVICTPDAVHAEQILDGLDNGLHVFCEKPLCVTVADADRIIAARDRTGLVVQVGYNNRHDDAFRALERALEGCGEIQAIGVRTYDPSLGRFFMPADAVRGEDVPADVVKRTRALAEAQTRAAVGVDDSRSVSSFIEIFLGTLVHDVNLVHALLRAAGAPLPAVAIDAAAWGPKLKHAQAVLGLENGARWVTTFMELPGIHDFNMRIEVFLQDAVHTLSIPSPYLAQAPSSYIAQTEQGGMCVSQGASSYREAYVDELLHFHDCAVREVRCITPPEEARLDIEVLTELFRLAITHWASEMDG